MNIGADIAALKRLTVKQMQIRYAEVFGETTRCYNRDWLVKRIAWRVQALAEGDLSERARKRAAELARDADLRTTMPVVRDQAPAASRQITIHNVRMETDDRLPPPGTILTRMYKGNTIQVKILPRGFEFDGEIYKSLSAVAKAITNSHCNGYLFFRLAKGDRE
jgi:Protein of unknown function (DUF2924)